MKFPSIFALALLTASAASFAQATPPTEEESQMQNQKNPENQQSVEAAQTDPHAVQGSGGADWSMMQGHEKGYLTKDDAQPNSWLALNFTSCDKDRDGKVTEAEYTKCQKPLR